jgi:peroxiredoxin
VNYQESRAEAQAFGEGLHLTFPVLLDPKGAVTRSYAVRALPVTYLIDRDGKVLWKATGRRDWDGPHGRAYFDRVLAATPH